MIRFRSQQKHYDEFYSGDPAFRQPPADLPDGVDEKAREAHKAVLDQYMADRRVARETGDWSKLLIDGQRPVKFTMRQMPGETYRAIRDMARLDKIGGSRIALISFRACLASISGEDEFKITRKHDETFGELLDLEIANEIDAVDKGIINEIGHVCFMRAHEVSPKL